MNSAFPPPVLIGTKRPSTLETCAAHGATGSANAARQDRCGHQTAAPQREQREHDDEREVLRPGERGQPEQHAGYRPRPACRPSSSAHMKLSTVPASVSVASGSLISLPVKKIVTG